MAVYQLNYLEDVLFLNLLKDQPLLHSPVARDAATGYLGQQASQNRYTRAAAVVGAIEGAHTLAHPISSVAGFLK